MLCAGAAAGVELVSAQREIYAQAAFDYGGPQIQGSTAFGSWAEGVSSFGTNPPPFIYQWTASAFQNSDRSRPK